MQAFGGAGDAPLAQNRLEDEQQVQIERAQIHRHHSFRALPFAINALSAASGKAYKTPCRAARASEQCECRCGPAVA
jgi:hypothetical protein